MRLWAPPLIGSSQGCRSAALQSLLLRCANPRPHLRLVYEGNPLAMLAEQVGTADARAPHPARIGGPQATCAPLQTPSRPPAQAGGRGSDGAQRVLEISPEALHQRLPLFLGSPDDIAELESYGDVQQGGGKKYDV